MTDYPVKAPKANLGLNFRFEKRRHCMLDGTGVLEYEYQNTTVPKSIKDGYILKIHDSYEVISSDAVTLNMIPEKNIMIALNAKVSGIDESLAADDIKL